MKQGIPIIVLSGGFQIRKTKSRSIWEQFVTPDSNTSFVKLDLLHSPKGIKSNFSVTFTLLNERLSNTCPLEIHKIHGGNRSRCKSNDIEYEIKTSKFPSHDLVRGWSNTSS